MTGSVPPALLLVLGGLLAALLPRRPRQALLLLLPVASFLLLLQFPHGDHAKLVFFDYSLTLVRIDKLSLVFAAIFHIATFLGVVYSLHQDDRLQDAAAMVYAGSAIGAVLAGDLFTLFVCWELSACAAAFLIWARRTPGSNRAGLRFLVVQVGSGVLLLAGIILHARETGSLAFGGIGLGSPASWLMFLAFGIKCAFPLLHNWLQDAYPEATPTGTVFLSAFTTKIAVYALARAFPGTPELIWIGAAMTAFPIFYAVIENDLRRVLCYSLNNQLGFMVVGVGLAVPGTAFGDLALNGACAHAFADILFKGLLFMSMGAVLHRTGTVNGSELGGLYKSMPWTTAFCMVGAASISAFPLFSGFVTKSMIIEATGVAAMPVVWMILVFASAGVFHHSGIKIPYFAFFGHDSGKRCAEAPWNMLVAMGITAALCIGIGVLPGTLYGLLPRTVEYVPYTTSHVVSQLQLLFFSGLAFSVLIRTGIYPPELRSTNLDSDWVYRKAFPAVWRGAITPAIAFAGRIPGAVIAGVTAAFLGQERPDGTPARAPRSLSSAMAVVVAVGLLFVFLLIDLIRAA